MNWGKGSSRFFLTHFGESISKRIVLVRYISMFSPIVIQFITFVSVRKFITYVQKIVQNLFVYN